MAGEKTTTKPRKKGLTPEATEGGYRQFNSESAGFYELNEEDSISGTFVSRRTHEIQDKNTKALKTIWVYTIRTVEGMVKLGGRVMLDRMFEDAIDSMFDGDTEALRGHEIVIDRLRDLKKDSKNIGQYNLRIKPKAI